MITFDPVAVAGDSGFPVFEIQSAALAKRSESSPFGHIGVIPMGCCLGFVAS